MAQSKAQHGSARLVITPRDLEMLRSLQQARFLTVEALEWLHFPTWRKRYAQWQEARGQGGTRPYIASAQLYSRLRRMEAARLVRRMYRPIALAVSVQKRDADLWMLAEQGANTLAAYGGVARSSIDVPDVRPRSSNTLQHSAEIGRVYAALRAKIETRPALTIAGWTNDYQTKRAYDRIVALVPQPGGAKHQQVLPVQPDGVLLLDHPYGRSMLLIEVERDRPPEAWKKKVYAWEAYRHSPELRARYDVDDFLVLAFSLTDAQRESLMETTAQAIYPLTGRNLVRTKVLLRSYLFCALPFVHPLEIGTAWHTIREVGVQIQRAGAGGSYERLLIEAAPHRLIA